jgi:hypothetical protein
MMIDSQPAMLPAFATARGSWRGPRPTPKPRSAVRLSNAATKRQDHPVAIIAPDVPSFRPT